MSDSDEHEIPCECRRCENCGGTGREHWYLGDEFNSQGYSTCSTCDGAGVITDDCALHHPATESEPI